MTEYSTRRLELSCQNTSRPRGDPPGSCASTLSTCEREPHDELGAGWAGLNVERSATAALLDLQARLDAHAYRANIERYVGTVRVPVGIAGPLLVHGESARGEYMVPLATTEATLVASFNRGASVVTRAGGCTARVLDESISRTPAFVFNGVDQARAFARWVEQHADRLEPEVRKTTTHGRLRSVSPTVEGNCTYLQLDFTTADASGQNIATFATELVCEFLCREAPVRPRRWYVEANLSGDKKATARSLGSVRGKRVCAEIEVPPALLAEVLRVSATDLVDYWRTAIVGAAMSGSVGLQGHYANGLAALYLACGQDVACVAESATGITRFELAEAGGLYASVTLPAVMVGTVGGGTDLPTQSACLDILGLKGAGHAQALAEVAAALVLAGELSIGGALAAGEFASAHQRLARARREQGVQGRQIRSCQRDEPCQQNES